MQSVSHKRARSAARLAIPLVVTAAAVSILGAAAVAAAPAATASRTATASGITATSGITPTDAMAPASGIAATGPTTSFDIALSQAFDACLGQSVVTDRRYTLLSPAAFYQCLGGRGYSAVASAPAGPGNLTTRFPTPSQFEIDLFRTFTSCLAEAAHPDSMYPGIDPGEVNSCLERHGF